MHNRSSRPKRPHDVNQLAKSVVDIATGTADVETKKNPAAVALGRLGGLKGGKARAKKLTKTQRSAIAREAAIARWGRSVKGKAGSSED